MNEPLNFVAEQEPWNVYRLEDGTIIRARLVMTRILKTDRLTDDGFPVYETRFQQIMDVTPSEMSKPDKVK